MRGLALLAALFALAQTAHGLYFYLQAGAERCFLEELPRDTIVVGKSNSRGSRGGFRSLWGPSVAGSHAEDAALTLGCAVTGHYKAEEWQDSSKSWILNDQLGIQITVAVRSVSLLVVRGHRGPLS